MKRILILSEPYPPFHPGGAGKLAQIVADNLAKRGYDITVVCADLNVDRNEQINGITVHRVKIDNLEWTVESFQSLTDRMLAKMLALHEQHQFNLIHDVGGFQYSEAFREFVAATRIPGITHLLLIMGMYLHEVGIAEYLVSMFHEFQRSQCMVSHQVITTSRYEQKLYEHLFKGCPDAEIIFNGIDEIEVSQEKRQYWNEVVRSENAITCLVAGRLSDKVKGIDRAVELVRKLTASGFEIILFGTNLLPKNKMDDDSIRLLGRLADEDFYAILSAADYVICPSRYEAFGLLPLEAVTLGTKVIASKIGGHLDIIDSEEKGILLDDTEWGLPDRQLTEYIINNRKKDISQQTRFPVPAPFSSADVADGVESVYQKITSE